MLICYNNILKFILGVIKTLIKVLITPNMDFNILTNERWKYVIKRY